MIKKTPLYLFIIIVILFIIYQNFKFSKNFNKKRKNRYELNKKIKEKLYEEENEKDDKTSNQNGGFLSEKELEENKNDLFLNINKNSSNHTLLKAGVLDSINMIRNVRKIDIDPRQLEIYNKYHKKNISNNETSPEPKNFLKLNESVNPHNFKYIINSPNICSNKDIFIIIYIHTSPKNYQAREVIRRTWGNVASYKKIFNKIIKIIFVMGIPPNLNEKGLKELEKSLKFEQGLYGDLVQEDFIDTYHNLTYKGIASLKWITKNCNQAKFVLKTDDDIFVNMFSLIKYLNYLQLNGKNLKNLILCAVWYQMPVLRKGKWKVLKEQWAGDVYPTYCSGSAFIMSTDVAIILHEVSYHVPFFWVDDFYITGLLPLKAGNIVHRQFGSAYVLNGDLLEKYFTGPQWEKYIFSHLKGLNRILYTWNKMTKLFNKETQPNIQKLLPGEVE